ncbi:hypothetical protein J6590_038888 [Homalodisca vitripennis]|nr:hypothetical protein J6590_038888 [Homalodisca vitripennis]
MIQLYVGKDRHACINIHGPACQREDYATCRQSPPNRWKHCDFPLRPQYENKTSDQNNGKVGHYAAGLLPTTLVASIALNSALINETQHSLLAYLPPWAGVGGPLTPHTLSPFGPLPRDTWRRIYNLIRYAHTPTAYSCPSHGMNDTQVHRRRTYREVA